MRTIVHDAAIAVSPCLSFSHPSEHICACLFFVSPPPLSLSLSLSLSLCCGHARVHRAARHKRRILYSLRFGARIPHISSSFSFPLSLSSLKYLHDISAHGVSVFSPTSTSGKFASASYVLANRSVVSARRIIPPAKRDDLLTASSRQSSGALHSLHDSELPSSLYLFKKKSASFKHHCSRVR